MSFLLLFKLRLERLRRRLQLPREAGVPPNFAAAKGLCHWEKYCQWLAATVPARKNLIRLKTPSLAEVVLGLRLLAVGES